MTPDHFSEVTQVSLQIGEASETGLGEGSWLFGKIWGQKMWTISSSLSNKIGVGPEVSSSNSNHW